MPRRGLSEDLRKVLVHMHYKRNLPAKEIAMLTSVKLRTIQNVLKQFHDFGTYALLKKPATRTWKVNDEHLEVCSTSLA